MFLLCLLGLPCLILGGIYLAKESFTLFGLWCCLLVILVAAFSSCTAYQYWLVRAMKRRDNESLLEEAQAVFGPDVVLFDQKKHKRIPPAVIEQHYILSVLFYADHFHYFIRKVPKNTFEVMIGLTDPCWLRRNSNPLLKEQWREVSLLKIKHMCREGNKKFQARAFCPKHKKQLLFKNSYPIGCCIPDSITTNDTVLNRVIWSKESFR